MGPKRASSQKVTLTGDQKRELINLVKQAECLWKISHKDYKRKDVTSNHWRKVKRHWKSLKDALRYKTLSKKPGKSGKPLESDESLDEDAVPDADDDGQNWEFWDDMQFVKESKPQRSTLSSDQGIETFQDEGSEIPSDEIQRSQSSTQNNNLETPVLGNKRPASNYDYTNKQKKKNNTDDGTGQLVSNIKELIDLRKAKKEELKFLSIYKNLDRMLCQLPDNVVEDLNMQFTQLAYAEIQKHRNIIQFEIDT